MSGVWLKCDACNKELATETERAMQLAVRFKPSVFTASVAPVHAAEHRQRCRACGWVNIFVPSAPSAAGRNSLLTSDWRSIELKS